MNAGDDSAPTRSALADVTLLAVVYFGLAVAAIYVARQPGTIAAVWLANAVAVAFILTMPRPREWLCLATVFISNFAANRVTGGSWFIASAFAVPNVLEIALATAILRRTGDVERFLSDHRSFLRLMSLGAFVPPLVSATLGAVLLELLSGGTLQNVWVDWYVGTALGAAGVLPLVLSLRTMPTREVATRRDLWGAVLGSALFSLALLGALRAFDYPFVLISTLLLVAASVSSRVAVFSYAAVLVCSMALALAFDWYAPPDRGSVVGRVQAYLSLLMVVIPAQIVAVLVSRQRALSVMLSAVGNRADSFVTFLDLSGAYRWVNRGRASYFRVANDSALGHTLAENEEPGTAEMLAPLVASAQRGTRALACVKLDTPLRGPRTFEVSAEPAVDEEGRAIGAVLCGTDITELEHSRRELELAVEELRAANLDLQQFVHIASHDLREPLNTIAQFSDLIYKTRCSQLDDAGRKYFDLVRTAVLRMRVLLDDVLRYVQVGSREREPRVAVDLDEVMHEIESSLRAQLERSGAGLEVGALGMVFGHRSLISLALQNLVSNAVKFVPPERAPQVQVLAERHGAEVHISVKDNGIGIEPERIASLGVPFRRLHSHRKFEGSGLGLAICKRVVEQNGGRLEIESALGVGSTFRLVLSAPPVERNSSPSIRTAA